MVLGVTIDAGELEKKLQGLAGVLTGAQMHRAIALGINKTLGTKTGGAKTQADREIRKVFNLKQKYVLKKIKTNGANVHRLVGEVKFPTTPIPMSEYVGTKGGKKDRRKKGAQRAPKITVEIRKGHPITFQGAFFLNSTKAPGGGMSLMIMHRSYATANKSYNGSFQFRHQRVQKGGNDLHIGAVFSPSPFGAEMNADVKKVMQKYCEENLEKNVYKMLDDMAAGYIRDSKNKGRYRR